MNVLRLISQLIGIETLRLTKPIDLIQPSSRSSSPPTFLFLSFSSCLAFNTFQNFRFPNLIQFAVTTLIPTFKYSNHIINLFVRFLFRVHLLKISILGCFWIILIGTRVTLIGSSNIYFVFLLNLLHYLISLNGKLYFAVQWKRVVDPQGVCVFKEKCK